MKTKIAGFALMGILAMMVIPGSMGTQESNDFTMYGAATMVQKDALGQEVFSQTVHNQVVDTGEEFLLDAVFQDGSTDVADDVQIGSICIGSHAPTVAETRTAADFDSANAFTEANCIEDTTVTTSGGTAVVGSLQFTCGGTNCANDDTIASIAICQNDTTDDLAFVDCATEGIMFAVVDVADTILAASETVDITYTFNIVSGSS